MCRINMEEKTDKSAAGTVVNANPPPKVKLTNTIYLHSSPRIIKKIYSKIPGDCLKPSGLWYSNGSAWRNFLAYYDYDEYNEITNFNKRQIKLLKDRIKFVKNNPMPKHKKDWYEFLRGEKYDPKSPYIRYMYKVVVNHVKLKNNLQQLTEEEHEMNRRSVLLIETLNEYLALLKKYGKIIRMEDEAFDNYDMYNNYYWAVDWNEIGKEYGGIEFKNVFNIMLKWLKKHQHKNYHQQQLADQKINILYSLDADSGCVWNKNAIKMYRIKLEEHSKKKKGRKSIRALRNKNLSAINTTKKKRSLSSPFTSTLISSSVSKLQESK